METRRRPDHEDPRGNLPAAGLPPAREASGQVNHPRPMQRMTYPLLLLAGVALAIGCHREAPSGAKPGPDLPVAEVTAQAARPGTYQSTDEVVGTVRARTRAVIEAKVSGRLTALRAAPGQRVGAGDLLAELEAQEVQARVEQARAVLQQAERELARFRTLLSQEAVTPSEFESVESRHRVARATLSEVETLLGYTRVTAPFAGVVTRKLADTGDLAGPGRPIVELEDPAVLRFEADVPASLIGRVRIGDRLPIHIVSVTGSVEGTVSEIEPSADPASRTFRIRLDLPSGIGAQGGLFGRVGIPAGESSLLAVPSRAVLRRGQLEFAYVVTNERAWLRLIRTGKRLGSEVEVLAGLEPGEQVATDGVGGLRDGQPVRVR